MMKERYPKVYLYKRIVQSKLFIDKNFADKIHINQISDEAYFSRFHFIRLFKQIYGATPYKYLISVRMDNAKLLLQKGQSVSAVCFSVGFDSLSSFSGLFKKNTGISPLAFFKKEQLRQQQIAEAPLKYVPGCFAHKFGWTKHSNFEEAT